MLSRLKGKGKTDQVVRLAGDQPNSWLECSSTSCAVYLCNKMKGKTDQVVKLAGDQPKNWRECPMEKPRLRLIGVANESKIRHDRRATIPKRMAEGVKQGGRAPASLNTSGVPGGTRWGASHNVPAP